MVPGIVGFLLGGYENGQGHVYEIGIDGSISKTDEFVSDGSGSPYALGVLELTFRKGMSIDEGIDLAVKAISSALERDIATGNGLVVYTITQDGVKEVMNKTITYGLVEKK